MQKAYLDIGKGSTINCSTDRALFRFFEILPGLLSWSTLIAAFILSYLSPITVAFFIIAFDFYWFFRIAYLSFHQIASYKQMKKNLKIDWLDLLKAQKPKTWEKIYHLVVLPFYKEGIEIADSTFQALEDSLYPKNKMIIVLATEERGGKRAQEIAEKIKQKWEGKFFQLLMTVHSCSELKREMPGKGSNVAWAVKKAREKITVPLSIPHENIIVSIFDIDTRPFPQYFAILTWYYLTSEKPLRSSYQPVPIYNNNIWDAPAFSRVISTSGTFWQMMQQERQEQLVTFASHSLPLKIFDQVGYPVNTVSDDSRIFWKCYLYYNGDYRVVPLHYPVSMDTVMAKNLGRTIINQYKQQRRWAWGVENIPYLLFGFLKNKKISLSKKIFHVFNVFDGFWSWATSTLLIFFLGWLPLILGGEEFNISLLSYNLPRLTSNIMTIAMIGMIIGAVISMLLLPPRPPRYSRLKNLSMFFQWILLPLTLISFGALPALDAQTRLIFKKYLGFWPTEKIRKKS